MGEAKNKLDAILEALKIVGFAITDLSKRVQQLENQNQNTKDITDQQEIIQGASGVQYTPQVFKGPSGIPRKTYPDSEEQQRLDEAVLGGRPDGNILA